MSAIETSTTAGPLAAGWLPIELVAGDAMPDMVRALFVGNPDMVFVTDAKGRIIAANPSAVAGFGYSREQLEGQSPGKLLCESVGEGHSGQARDFQEHLANRVMGSGLELKARDARGNEFQVEGSLHPFAAKGMQYTMTIFRRLDTALRKANRALVESEERFRLLVEPVTDYGIFMLDPEGCVVTWNVGAERIKGYKAEEVLGRNYSMFFLPEAVEAGTPSQEMAEAAREGRFEAETWRVRKNGTKFWALVTLTAIRGQDGALRGFAKVFRDMTSQKEAEEALLSLNSQLEHYRIVVEHIDEYAIYTLDAEGIITSWGTGAQKVSGAPAKEVIGQHYSFFFSAAAVLAGVPQRELAEAARTGRYAADAWMVTPDGDRKWSSGVLNSVRDESGKLTGFIRVARDMTSYKQADEDLREANRALVESEERFRLLVEPVKEYAIFMLDPLGRILTWNEGAERSKGYKASEVVGRNFAMFYLPADAQAGLPAADLATAASEGRFETEAWRRRKDGTKFWGLVTLTALHLKDGALRGFATVTRDMTKQKELEESLQRMTADLEDRVLERTRDLETAMKELRRKNEEVEAFVYIVSHDLRAPLVNVQGFVRELEESSTRLTALLNSCSLPENHAAVHEILDGEIAGALHFISASATKFERLIDALIGLSRHGRQAYQIVNVDVDEQVANAVATFNRAITEAGAVVEVGPLPTAQADATALGQVFSNLIGNAIKYRSPDRPLKIAIGGQVEDDTVHYWVRDNGLGIPESGKARLFKVFQRLHPQVAPGEGMGLAIVHRIVGRHEGKVWAESREGEGSTFHFSLPSNPGSTTNVEKGAEEHGTH